MRAVGLALALAAAGATNRLPAFTATAVEVARPERKPVVLDARRLGRATVWVTMGVQCPYTRLYVERLRTLEQASPEVRFVYVYPNVTEDEAAKREYHRRTGLAGPAVVTDGARVARALGAEQTSEVVLARPDGTIVYRGAIDDSAMDPGAVTAPWLADALAALRRGNPPVAKTPVSGCELQLLR